MHRSWKSLRLTLVMRFASWLRVPVTPHQRYFLAGNRDKNGKSLNTVSSVK